MAWVRTGLVNNMSFYLRIVECVLCLIFILVRAFSEPREKSKAEEWLEEERKGLSVIAHYLVAHGWFLVSLAYIVVYKQEPPTAGLQIVLLVFYALFALGTAPILAIVMVVDIVFLCITKNR